MQTLEGKIALVTGAGSGLGQATACALASVGCTVACVDVRGDAAKRSADQIERQG